MAFNITSEMNNGIARLNLHGDLDGMVAELFRDEVSKASALTPRRIVFDMTDLAYMSSAGLRVLVFARQKMGSDVDIFVIGANEGVAETIEMTGFHYSVTMLDTYDASQIENFA